MPRMYEYSFMIPLLYHLPLLSEHTLLLKNTLLLWHKSLRQCYIFLITLHVSPRHFGQYHLPFGFVVSPTQLKWNHSITQASLSHPIISPYETCSQRQYVGSSGSIGGSIGDCSFSFLTFRFFFFFGIFSLSSCK